MSEASRFWNTTDVGDGPLAGYSGALVGAWLKAIFARNGDGILARVLNELAVSGTASPLTVATGAAIVDGKFYSNDAALNLTVAIPSTGTTGGRVVLEANWTAQTVRAKAVKNTDGNAAIPALTQNSGTTYQISLASFTITTGGAITVTVETARASMANSPRAETIDLAAHSVLGRAGSTSGVASAITASADGQALRRSGTSIAFGQIAAAGITDDAVTAAKLSPDLVAVEGQFANGAVDTDQIAARAVTTDKIGNRVPTLEHRQGGSSSDWNLSGANNYAPGRVLALFGVTSVTVSSGYGASVDVTLPVSLSKPLVFAGIIARGAVGDENHIYSVYAVAINSTTIRIIGKRDLSWIESVALTVAWMAIGPES